MSDDQSEKVSSKPRGNLRGFSENLRNDITSGFFVFLIALPLCLGISLASGFPPIAGIFTAILGALIAPLLSNSELTIKGPAAGLIVIVIGCIEEFGGDGALGGFTAGDMAAYKAALAVAVVAALLQIGFALFRAGILGEFFPAAAVHGMLAAIGVIIIAKQVPVALGVAATGEPLEMLAEIPHYVMEANPAIAAIGIASVLIMFLWPLVRTRVLFGESIPAPLVVLLIAVPMGMAFDLLHEHSYMLQGHQYQLGEQYLVTMPGEMFGMFSEITTPDFAVLSQFAAWKWAFMFFMIGSLESVLSAKAVDTLDPWRRKSDMNRDLLAVGTGNLACAFVGGLPMISEIVRSKANIDNGARTRFANFWHGVFLLVCVALIPMMLHRIPLAALAAMLIYTGFRLAHPQEFINVFRIGREQLAIFVTTLVAVLATDLLIGVLIGIALKFLIHLMNGVPLRSLFKPYLEIEQLQNSSCVIRAKQSAVFSNWIPFRRQIEDIGLIQRQNITIDLSDTKLVDHSVMEKLHELEDEFHQEGLKLEIVGLDFHQPLSSHSLSARKQGFASLQRLTIIASELHADIVRSILASTELKDALIIPASPLLANQQPEESCSPEESLVRVEAFASQELCRSLLSQLSRDPILGGHFSASIETVEVLLPSLDRAAVSAEQVQ